MRFLLLDRITLWEPGVRASAIKCVALSEDFFDDHFPLKPIMPGVLILEGMAQLSGLLVEEGVRLNGGRVVKALMTIIEKAKFRRPVLPGDTLEYRAEVISVNDVGARVAVQACKQGDRIADCSLVFSFHAFHNPRLEEQRREILSLWLREPEDDAQS